MLHGPTPAVVYVHGGGWVSGNFNSGGFLISTIGPSLAARGFVVVSLDYRLGPGSQWPDQIEDVKCAVRFLRANAQRSTSTRPRSAPGARAPAATWCRCWPRQAPRPGWDVGPYRGTSSQVQSVVDMAGPSDLLTMGTQGDAALVATEFRRLLGSVAPADLRLR